MSTSGDIVAFDEGPHVTFNRTTRRLACSACGDDGALDEGDAEHHIMAWAAAHRSCKSPADREKARRSVYGAGVERGFGLR